MEEAPPSYQEVTQADIWQFIGPYLQTIDLLAAAAVCKRWHTAFAPHLWGDPASHFHLNEGGSPIGWARFRATLASTRLGVRCMTHTLRIPATLVDFHDSPELGWLRLLLHSLPSLQSLIIRAVPFVDHAALQALGDQANSGGGDHASSNGVIEDTPITVASVSHTLIPHALGIPVSLRLLDISHCPNVTAHGLEIVLTKFVNLMYLDLSSTRAARESRVLVCLRRITGLQVLKLRGIGLRDVDIELISSILLCRTKSLDIRDNRITDHGLHSLAQHCFAPLTQAGADLSSLGAAILAIHNGEEFEPYLYKTFTRKFVAQLVIESIEPRGLTHLYLSGNPVTTEGVSGIVKIGRLHVLDIGSIDISAARNSAQRGDAKDATPVLSDSGLFETALAKHAAQNLNFLRIKYDILGARLLQDHSHLTKSGSGWFGFPTVGDKNDARVVAAGATLDDSGLTPSMLPHLATLVLTDVPQYVAGSEIADKLIRYVQACARESSLAWDQAYLDYALPPGRRRDSNDLRYLAYSKFALRRLILEVCTSTSTSSHSSHAQGHSNVKSLTQDPDGDVLWNASAADFSFFKNDPATDILPEPLAQRTEDNSASADSSLASNAGIERRKSLDNEIAIVDNIALLSAFRRERKAAHQKTLELNVGAATVQTEGFWEGTIQVIRE